MPENNERTRLLFACEGEPGDTALPDTGVGGRAKTVTNGGVLTADQAKYGSTSLRCAGVATNVTVAPTYDWLFGPSDFMIDGWFWFLANPFPWVFYLDADNWFGLEHVRTWGTGAGPASHVNYNLRLRVAGQDLIPVDASGDGAEILTGAWVYLVVARQNGRLWYLVDGEDVGYADLPSTRYPLNLQSWPLYVGRGVSRGFADLRHMNGYVDEFRIQLDSATLFDPPVAGLKGVTVPAAAFQATYAQVGGEPSTPGGPPANRGGRNTTWP